MIHVINGKEWIEGNFSVTIPGGGKLPRKKKKKAKKDNYKLQLKLKDL